MNKAIHPRLAALLFTLALASVALAGDPQVHEEHVIKVKTSGADVFEADLNELAVGESRTFVTDSGKTIDLIRTADGAEVYIDGELVDISAAALDGDHVIMRHSVEVECISDEQGQADCSHDAAFIGDVADGDFQVIHKQFEVVCDAGEDCEDMVWVTAEGDYSYEFESLEDLAGDDHQVIVIRKQVTESLHEE